MSDPRCQMCHQSRSKYHHFLHILPRYLLKGINGINLTPPSQLHSQSTSKHRTPLLRQPTSLLPPSSQPPKTFLRHNSRSSCLRSRRLTKLLSSPSKKRTRTRSPKPRLRLRRQIRPLLLLRRWSLQIRRYIRLCWQTCGTMRPLDGRGGITRYGHATVVEIVGSWWWLRSGVLLRFSVAVEFL